MTEDFMNVYKTQVENTLIIAASGKSQAAFACVRVSHGTSMVASMTAVSKPAYVPCLPFSSQRSCYVQDPSVAHVDLLSKYGIAAHALQHDLRAMQTCQSAQCKDIIS